jgi:hypothetical protein
VTAGPAALINSVHTISVVMTVAIRAENLLVRLALHQTSLDLRHNEVAFGKGGREPGWPT